ncbi:MAG: YbaB/EbfC family nucleoid-associated protein [Nitrospinae bacterium]|nr:YbaB/EbfC family nucleoid-associated protein [Nitrospinota bacterium]MCH7767886.1 YbaB/EbfC family nucleoid-associated protein [Nitrospinota bacterium]
MKGLIDLMKTAQNMQAELSKLQEKLAGRTVEATVGGGMVKVVANGRREILSVDVDTQVVDSADVEMLQDLICAAVNEALRKAQALETEEMKRLTGSLGLPFDLMGLLGR